MAKSTVCVYVCVCVCVCVCMCMCSVNYIQDLPAHLNTILLHAHSSTQYNDDCLISFASHQLKNVCCKVVDVLGENEIQQNLEACDAVSSTSEKQAM